MNTRGDNDYMNLELADESVKKHKNDLYRENHDNENTTYDRAVALDENN